MRIHYVASENLAPQKKSYVHKKVIKRLTDGIKTSLIEEVAKNITLIAKLNEAEKLEFRLKLALGVLGGYDILLSIYWLCFN